MEDPNTPSVGGGSNTPHASSSGREQVENEARDVAGAVKHEAAHQFEKVKSVAREEADELRGHARSFADDQKHYAADRLDGMADAVNRVADELEGEQEMIARYARQLAGGVNSMAEQARSSSVDELVHKASDFGRQNPAAFLGAAALLGFAASRFLTASSHRVNEGASRQTDNLHVRH